MPTEIVLDNNLVLRSLRGDADKERFAVFNTAFNNPFEGATCSCLMHHHPETTLDDYWLVEDPSSGEVVSTTCLLPWVCRFDGIDLRVAQLEMVLTHPAYRSRGLVRAQIKHFEQVVLERGYDLSIISGIPYYYRQFGYAYAIDGDRCEALPVWKIPDHPSGCWPAPPFTQGQINRYPTPGDGICWSHICPEYCNPTHCCPLAIFAGSSPTSCGNG